jgi:hypothetical protein
MSTRKITRKGSPPAPEKFTAEGAKSRQTEDEGYEE